MTPQVFMAVAVGLPLFVATIRFGLPNERVDVSGPQSRPVAPQRTDRDPGGLGEDDKLPADTPPTDNVLLTAADADAQPASSASSNRIAARWALASGAVRIEISINGEARSISALSELPSEPFALLAVLFRSNDQVTNEALEGLRGLPQLRRVEFVDCASLNVFSALGSCSKLTELNLSGTSADDRIWKSLSPLRDLQRLSLSTTQLTGTQIEDLGIHESTQHLELDGIAINDASAQAIRKVFPSLRSLSLKTDELPSAVFVSLAGMTSLESLDVHQGALSDGVLLALVRFPRLRELTVYGGTEEAVPERIALLENLESLAFESCQKPSISTKWLAALPKLTSLRIEDTPLNEAGLKELEGIASLKRLTLGNTAVSARAVKAFQGRREDVEVTFTTSVVPVSDPSSDRPDTRSTLPIEQDGLARHVHDPTLVKMGKTYYVYSTGAGIPIRQSTDLVHWKEIAPAFSENPQWAVTRYPKNKGLWGPDISHFGGQYHMYYCAAAFGTNNSVIGHATNRTLDPSSPSYKWIDHGPVLSSTPGVTSWNALDPHVVLDEAKRPWLMFGSFFSGLKLVRLGAETGKPVETREDPIAIARRDGNGAIEAPFVIRRGKFFYLFASHDFCCRGSNSNYRVIVGRSENIAGPYVDRQNRKLLEGGGTTVLASYGDVRGPGHCAILQDGKEMWMAHHAYDRTKNGVPTLHIRSVIWAGPEGWPLVGEPITEPNKAPPKTPPSLAGKWKHFVDYGPEFEAVLLPDGSMQGRNATWERTGPLAVRMKFPDARAEGGVFVNDCYVDPHAQWYVCRYGQNTIIRGYRVVTP